MINRHHLPLAVYYEHPEWFRPLFAELDRRSIQYVRIDAGCHGYDPTAADRNYALLVNRMSASAYLRGNVQGIFFTRDYLAYLREAMGRAARDLEPFDDAYAKTDWTRFRGLPAFEPANRINAWGTYLRMEQEALNDGSP